ncbi:GntR family transcriptional regulator [Streptomyces sp. NPDC001617]
MGEARSGDGGGRAFDRVLRALQDRIAQGVYPQGGLLPPQRDLAAAFGVSRDTVQRVLRELISEGLVQSRRGSGSRVVGKAGPAVAVGGETRGRPGSLGLFIVRAFEQPKVALDVYTLTSESLFAHIRLQAERVMDREVAPESIVLRLLLPAEGINLLYPRNMRNPADSRLQDRLREITRSHVGSLKRILSDLKSEDLVPSVVVAVRHVETTPTHKLYLSGGTEALFGAYEPVERTIQLDNGEEIEALDVLGLGAHLTHHVKDDFVEKQQSWFNSAWERMSVA